MEREALKWLDDKVREETGAVFFGTTEDGDVGVWIGPPEEGVPALGVGDTAEEAINDAVFKEDAAK